MQAQAVRTDQNQAVVTSQQSLQSIKTLLRAGLGCITYLRNLLPSDNFSESYLTSSAPDSLSSQPSMSRNSIASTEGRHNVSGFKIMTVTRGFTEEADRLLDYLENGIFDALQKQYLRSFIFAIYLDDQDPNNIIESYTFNFTYCKTSGSENMVPVMSLGADMMNLSLSGSGASYDPVADATRRGRIPTLGEVKRSLKALIKNLIQATTQMDALPKRRFATFKLFYYENTPDDYEPPHFRAGDANLDKWFMSTHDKAENPERCSVGSVQTGYHGVDVKIASVCGYLPSAEDNSAPFLGITSGNTFGPPPLTPAEEAAVRAQQVEIQRRDALERRVIWDADEGLSDAGGTGGHSGDSRASLDQTAPLGVRDEQGNVVPLNQEAALPRHQAKTEAQYTGRPEPVPLSIGQLAKSRLQPGDDFSPTQELEDTQVISSHHASAAVSRSHSSSLTATPTSQPEVNELSGIGSSLPPSDIEAPFSLDTAIPQTIDTQMIRDALMQGASAPQDDSMILDIETQRGPALPDADDPIQSFSASSGIPAAHDGDISMERHKESAGEVECECGVQIEDCDCCKCDGGCGRWYHLWCMGYHSAQDFRIPSKFICFDCRVKADRNWDLIVVHDLYPRMIARFKDLAIQRRGIKVFEAHAPTSLSAFTKLIGCESTVAGQVFKRLEAEGFIAQQTRETDETGFLETTSLASKRKTRAKAGVKGKAAQRRKNLQKPIYVFIPAIKNEDVYKDYFNPDPEVEKRLLALSDLRKTSADISDEHDHSRKKVKISLGPAVDLGD
ncbi:HORMA-domain-containing protein [Trametes punicea]|nr:HORMA-domain-containing protein [Trametes punicea]